MAKVTIEDISNSTGLSRGTVSRALNNRPDISSITKQRVLDACKELGYSPSHAARALATGRCFAVAVVVDDLHMPFSADYLRGAIGAARPACYAVHVAELAPDFEASLSALTSFVHERVDTVLVASSHGPALNSHLASFAKTRPVVAIGAVDGAAADQVGPDFAESGRLVTQHVLSRDRENAIYVFDGTIPHEERQAAGARQALMEAGLAPSHCLVDAGPPSPSRLARIRDRILGARAIAAGADTLAVEILVYCLAEGRRLGRDFSIAGQGNAATCPSAQPWLTSTDYGGEEAGRRSFTLALERLTNVRHDGPQSVLVAPRLIQRDSTS